MGNVTDMWDRLASYVAVAFFCAMLSGIGGTCAGRNQVCEKVCRSRGFDDGSFIETAHDDLVQCDCWSTRTETVPVP